LGGLSVASLLAFLSGKIDFPKLLTDVAGFVNEQLKEMSSLVELVYSQQLELVLVLLLVARLDYLLEH